MSKLQQTFSAKRIIFYSGSWRFNNKCGLRIQVYSLILWELLSTQCLWNKAAESVRDMKWVPQGQAKAKAVSEALLPSRWTDTPIESSKLLLSSAPTQKSSGSASSGVPATVQDPQLSLQMGAHYPWTPSISKVITPTPNAACNSNFKNNNKKSSGHRITELKGP